MLVMALHLCWAQPGARTPGDLALCHHRWDLLLASESRADKYSCQQRGAGKERSNTAQLLHQKIRHWPSDHQVQPWPPASPHILTPLLLLPPCTAHQPLPQELGNYKLKTKPMEGVLSILQTSTAAWAPSPRRDHINHYHFRCFCWSCQRGFDTFEWLDTF